MNPPLAACVGGVKPRLNQVLDLLLIGVMLVLMILTMAFIHGLKCLGRKQ